MTREQLRQWLSVESADKTAFTLAVLRDVFAEEWQVQAWLRRPRAELKGRTAHSVLSDGERGRVEQLAVRTWNAVARRRERRATAARWGRYEPQGAGNHR